MKNTYKVTGTVYGKLWGGGSGAYPACTITGASREEVIEQAKKMLANGSLDSGMGYENLIGAVLDIACTSYIEKNGKVYSNIEHEEVVLGTMNEETVDFCRFAFV